MAQTTITIESWRSDDLAIWKDKILPKFMAANPDIKVEFTPTPPTEYNAALNSKLQAGTAGDLITCRPFDASLKLHQDGHLAGLNSVKALSNFSDVAKSAWQTDDGKTTFCVPMASVIHGFIYNKDLFAKAGVTPPKTDAEFFEVLRKLKSKKITPLAMGTKDQWEAATMGFQNIGPNFWAGEKGRKGLIAGTEKFTAPGYVKTFVTLAQWAPFLPRGFSAQSYSDSQNQFLLGRAAIYPAGSWEIAQFSKEAKFGLGAFPPTVTAKGDNCYISDHTDIGIGMNAASKNKAAAMKFLEWVGSKEFAEIYANEAAGFFSLSNHKFALNNPLAQEFVSWRNTCKSTIRNSYQILSRGEPNLENEIWATSVGVIEGKMTPKDAAARLQQGLDKWYKPQN